MRKIKRLLVDMSATLIHHGHIRLLKKARELAEQRDALVIVALTSDEEILRVKGYLPELSFAERKETLLACRYVDEVVESPWLFSEETLDQMQADYLLHGSDNSNPITDDRLIVVSRTQGVSSSELRIRAAKVIQSQINKRKIMLTPGPAAIPFENVFAARPLFGRGDHDFNQLEERVTHQLRRLTGLPCLARLQGSASLALEVATHSFVSGRVLVIDTGYYCQRLLGYCQTLHSLGRINQLDIIGVDAFLAAKALKQLPISECYDWLVSVYSETSTALLNDIDKLYKLKKQVAAKLFLDATASIGLEQEHHLADLIAFSSCKGLAAMTGAAFICYQDDLQEQPESSFYLNVRTHIEKKITGPYHQLAALDSLLPMQDEICQRVQRSKNAFMARFGDKLVLPPERQPLIATSIYGEMLPDRDGQNIVFYQPRTIQKGQAVVCHLGELHLSSEQPSIIPPLLQLKN